MPYDIKEKRILIPGSSCGLGFVFDRDIIVYRGGLWNAAARGSRSAARHGAVRGIQTFY